MQIKQYKHLGLAAVTGICLLSLALPLFYRNWGSGQLSRQGTLRPETPGMLSDAAQEHPLIYALYRNRFAVHTALELPGDTQQIKEELQTKTESLADAGALPDLVARRARWILEQPAQETACKSENGFAGATYLIKQEEAPGSCWISACWQENTGVVVSYSVTEDAAVQNLEHYLEAYRNYLGVEELTDWQAGTREREAWAWSQAGQLSLFCCRQGSGFLLGAVSQAEPRADWLEA